MANRSLCGWLQTRNELYVDVDHVYDGDCLEWGYVKHEEIMNYLCGACGYVIEFKDEEDIAEWLIAHCNQDWGGPLCQDKE